MKKNMGNTDVAIRITTAFLIIFLYFFSVFIGTVAVVLVGIAAVLLITGLYRFCPLYALFGISTCRRK